jgi:hypothetical protein
MSFANWKFKKVDICQQKPNDLKIGCKFPSNLVEFVEKDEIVEE